MRSCNLRIFWAAEVFFHSVDSRGEVYHRQIYHIYSGISKDNFLFSLHLDHHLVSQIVSQFPGSFSSSLHCFWSVWVHTVSVLFLVVVYCFNYCVHLRSFGGSLRVILHLCFFLCIICHFVSLAFVIWSPFCHTVSPFALFVFRLGLFCLLLMILSVLWWLWIFVLRLCSFASFVFFVILVYFSSFRVSFGSLCAELLCILCYLFIVHALWSFLSLLSFILLAHSMPIFV